jgi:hypothetical protein
MVTGEIDDKNYRMADTYSVGFWHPILICPKFTDFIENKYAVAAGSIMQAEDVIEDLGTGKRKAEEATDTYFYGFEINGGK